MRQQVGNYFKDFCFQFSKNGFEQVQFIMEKFHSSALFRVGQRGKNGSRKTATGLLTEFS